MRWFALWTAELVSPATIEHDDRVQYHTGVHPDRDNTEISVFGRTGISSI
jgi:hypothetical protein